MESYGNYGNYSTTTYNSGGGAGGGGFLSGGSQQSPSGGGGYKNDSLRPVTIKQLMEAESPDNNEFKIDGVPIAQLTIVGQVRNISTQTTNVTYRLDDGTGVAEVKVWIDPEADDSRPQITENTYVRAWGRLKAFNNKRHLGAHFIRPLKDLNEINYHLLEATAVHLAFTRGPPGGVKANGEGGGSGGGAGDDDSRLMGLSKAARQVMQILRTTPTGNEGLHTQEMASRGGMEIADVQKGCDELGSLSLIYSTIDDHTWQLMNPNYG